MESVNSKMNHLFFSISLSLLSHSLVAQQRLIPYKSMTIKHVITSLIEPFSTVQWKEERNLRETYKNPLYNYSYNYVLPEPHHFLLFDHPVHGLYAYVENGKLIAFYLAVESEQK
jgi:hypothetical protein